MAIKFEEFFQNLAFTKLWIFLLGVITIWLLVRLLKNKVFVKIQDNESRYRAQKLSGGLAAVLSILFAIILWSDKLGGFTMALGVAGAGIAFSLQEVIASFAGWLAIMFGGFYKSGDRVQLGGIRGDVMDIGMLRTTIMETGQWVDGDLYNGRIVLIANSFIFKEPVFNYSGDFPFLWDEIKIPIQYGSNYDLVNTILLKVGKNVIGDLSMLSHTNWKNLQKKYLLEDAQTEPMVSLICNDNWVEFTLRFVVDYKKRRITKSQLFMQILKEVEATKGEVKFASATFQMVDSAEIKVKMS
ncbi:mechanosensitive ion channel family protein [Lacihabitans sp. LS3-19]|uniref:mechanosensitive ion channel family protein n=1 Tax=Lacihabitans sp. LS3-19 TaxID=2487335 RepID=UPI0020CFB3B8|nr:mechanosensitive ion channel domain-containing protein [Lacihabitans sp. LS3-19]MCP9766858.1 mechanosensitive ion channel family protein [Lacihabitans sp. LS3-19]